VPRPEPRLSYLVGRLDRALRRQLTEALRPLGVTLPQFTALSVLHSRSGLSNAQLARRALITPQSMIEVTAALERRGLIERRADPGHARILRAAITAEGENVLTACAAAVDEVERRMLAALPADARERLAADLTGLLDMLGAGFGDSGDSAETDNSGH
jgi:DNA-binding MarR family transcriptional regulator